MAPTFVEESNFLQKLGKNLENIPLSLVEFTLKNESYVMLYILSYMFA